MTDKLQTREQMLADVTTSQQQAVPVAQEDREAAATLEAILRDVWDGYSSVHAIREGCADGSSIVQAFARHRLAAINATQTREAELAAALTEARLGFLALSGELDDETQLAWSKKHVAKIDAALSPQTLPAPPLSTDVQSAATGFHDQDDSLKVALPAPGEVERAAVVAYIRRQSDRGADIGNEKPKGSTARAAFGGGSLALKRVADNIEAGEHILNDNAALATVAAANDEGVARIRSAIWGYVNAQSEDAATLSVVQFLANRDVFLAEAIALATSRSQHEGAE